MHLCNVEGALASTRVRAKEPPSVEMKGVLPVAAILLIGFAALATATTCYDYDLSEDAYKLAVKNKTLGTCDTAAGSSAESCSKVSVILTFSPVTDGFASYRLSPAPAAVAVPSLMT